MASTSKGRKRLLPVGSVKKSLPFTGCYETRQMGMFLHILVVGHTIFDHRAGDEVLEFVLITLVEGFELVVYVYDEVLPYIGECIFLLRIYLTCVAVTFKRRRTKQIKKGSLELTLFSCQYKAGMVTAFTVVHRIGNHCHKPFGKVRQPLLGVTDGNARCKIGDGALVYLYLVQHF